MAQKSTMDELYDLGLRVFKQALTPKPPPPVEREENPKPRMMTDDEQTIVSQARHIKELEEKNDNLLVALRKAEGGSRDKRIDENSTTWKLVKVVRGKRGYEVEIIATNGAIRMVPVVKWLSWSKA